MLPVISYHISHRLEAEKTYLVKMLMDKAAEDAKYLNMDNENMPRVEGLSSACEDLGCVQHYLE